MPRELERFEELLARALLAADPWKELQAAISAPSTPQAVREALGKIDEDGLRITGLLVAKLRFERLMNGSRRAAEWFETDPAEFTEAFRGYHVAVAPRDVFPSLEARRFEHWLAAR